MHVIRILGGRQAGARPLLESEAQCRYRCSLPNHPAGCWPASCLRGARPRSPSLALSPHHRRLCRPPREPRSSPLPRLWGGTNYYSWVTKWDNGTWLTYDQQQNSGVKAHQLVIVPKLGMASPAEGQVLVPSNKKCSLWISGRELFPGGYIQYKETVADSNVAVDAMYDHCLMFQTYLNYQTWDSTTVAGATVRPEILRVVDFLNVMYFKDP